MHLFSSILFMVSFFPFNIFKNEYDILINGYIYTSALRFVQENVIFCGS